MITNDSYPTDEIYGLNRTRIRKADFISNIHFVLVELEMVNEQLIC